MTNEVWKNRHPVDFLALLNLGMNFFMKGARRAPFIKKFIHEISNTDFLIAQLIDVRRSPSVVG